MKSETRKPYEPVRKKNSEKSLFMKLKEDERELRKNFIIDAALKLFKRKPFDEIGMREIAAEAGVSAASIYRYFPSQEELFIESFIKDLKAAGQKLRETLDQHFYQMEDPDVQTILEQLAEGIINQLLENEATFQMMSFLIVKGKVPDHLLDQFNEIQRSLLEKIDEVMVIFGLEGDLRIFSHAFFASINGVLMTYRNYPGRDKEEIKEHIHRIAKVVAIVFEYGLPVIQKEIDSYEE